MTAPTQPAPLDLDALDKTIRALFSSVSGDCYVGLFEERCLVATARNALPVLLAEARENRTSRDRIAELERENAELREALQVIAGERYCPGQIVSDKDVAKSALSGSAPASKAKNPAPLREALAELRPLFSAARLVSETHGAKAPDHE